MFPNPEVVSSYHFLTSNLSSPWKKNLRVTEEKLFRAVGGEQGGRWVRAWGSGREGAQEQGDKEARRQGAWQSEEEWRERQGEGEGRGERPRKLEEDGEAPGRCSLFTEYLHIE